MQSDVRRDRRDFLAATMTAAGSALAAGLSCGDAQGQGPVVQGHGGGSPLSLDSLYDTSVHATSLKGEAADRLALRRLVDAWAHCADRRLAQAQAELFTPEGTIVNYEGDPVTHPPHSTIKGREAIRSALAVLNSFTVTLHMNGQSDAVLQGDRAVGETYCLVHQFKEKSGQRTCQTLGIRYHDQLVRQESRWYFLERRVIIDWSDSRLSVP